MQSANKQQHIRYFIANILYNKVRKDWPQLEVPEQYAFISALTHILYDIMNDNMTIEHYKADHIYIHRIILTLCNSYLQMNSTEGLLKYLNIIFSLFQYESNLSLAVPPIEIRSINKIKIMMLLQNNTQYISKLFISLQMLIILPDEIEAINISHSILNEMKVCISNVLDRLYDTMDDIAEYLFGILSNLSQEQGIYYHIINELYLFVLKFIRSWLCYGMTLSKLYLEHR